MTSSPSEIPSPEGRILEAAEGRLFSPSPADFTMDELAGDLGMSKKTLYLHFPGKEAILNALIDGIGSRMRRSLTAILERPGAGFSEKLAAVIDTIGGQISRIPAALFRLLKRNHPRQYERLDALRSRLIPEVFGRLLAQGREEGAVRADVDPAFAALFWLQAVRGLIEPDALERTGLSPRETLEAAVDLFFGGILTEPGRRSFASRRRPSPRSRA